MFTNIICMDGWFDLNNIESTIYSSSKGGTIESDKTLISNRK